MGQLADAEEVPASTSSVAPAAAPVAVAVAPANAPAPKVQVLPGGDLPVNKVMLAGPARTARHPNEEPTSVSAPASGTMTVTAQRSVMPDRGP
jgi:hypothetical protein